MSKINPEIMSVLQSCVVEGNKIKLTCGELEREVYQSVNDILRRIGGTWKGGKTSAHVFNENPTDLLAAVIETGEFPENNPLAYFPTPAAVVHLMLEEVGLYDELTVLEPSAGQGGISKQLLKLEPGLSIDACELDPINRRMLQGVNLVGTDFLAYQTEKKYDRIIMNPPFSVEGDHMAWATHIYHAWSMLHKHGKLVVIVPNGWELKKSKKDEAFKDFIDDKLTCYTFIESGAFKESGTSIATVCLTLEHDAKDPRNCCGYTSQYSYEFFLVLDNDQKSVDMKYEGFEKIKSGLSDINTEFNKLADYLYTEYQKEYKQYLSYRHPSVRQEYEDQYQIFSEL